MNLYRVKNYLESINNFRRQTGIIKFYQLTKVDLELRILKKPEGRKVLILSPHSDDALLGCGGTLALYPKKTEIKIIYFTGEKKNSKEIFFNLPAGKFAADEKITAKFLYYLRKSTPDVIYLPFLLDSDPDHQEVCRIFFRACQRFKKEVKLYSYETWQPIFPNRLIDITKIIDKKQAAIQRDEQKAILSLNQYRGAGTGASSYAEAFFACDRTIWVELVKHSGID